MTSQHAEEPLRISFLRQLSHFNSITAKRADAYECHPDTLAALIETLAPLDSSLGPLANMRFAGVRLIPNAHMERGKFYPADYLRSAESEVA